MTTLLLIIMWICLIATAVLAGIMQGGYHVKPIDKMHNTVWKTFYCGMTNSHIHVYDEQLITQFNLGIRGWIWQKYEHAMMFAVYVGCGIIGWLLISHFVTTWEYLVTLCLVFLIAWFCFEPCYNYARYKSIVPPDEMEHINFFDMFSKHLPSRLMHSVRLILIAVFIGIMVITKQKEK